MIRSVLARATYANVAATLALVFSMSGGALAATHYVIKSQKQISPGVLRALKGKAGPAGPAGPQGAPGAAGAAGAPGTAKAYAQVISNGSNVSFGSATGFSGNVQHPAVGVYCVPAPAGVNADSSPIQLTFSGGSAGFISQFRNNNCAPGTYQIETANTANQLADANFNILVP